MSGSLNTLPQTRDTLVLRTNFDDDLAWETVCAEICRSSCAGFVEEYTCLSDPAWADFPNERLTQFAPPPSFFLVVDALTIEHDEHPILAIHLRDRSDSDDARTFRLVPAEATSLSCNLNIANMDFSEFAGSVDPDGIFRGFRP